MPVCLNSIPAMLDTSPLARWLCNDRPLEAKESSDRCLRIGLINNMPDGALEATENQFISLLDSASDGIPIRFAFYSMPGVPRSESGARHVKSFYSSTQDLLNTQLDGLIVTGREPVTPSLRDEPYWQSFAEILEWARDNTYSTVWSCLAAHAAVLHLDGIERVRSNNKHCGVFECEQLSRHQLTYGTPLGFALPHSRWNGLSEAELMDCGYSVLTRAGAAGVDTFVKQLKSLFVFFQGHPEYESNTLLLEYRRDVGRYLRGETDRYPSMPYRYFDRSTVKMLEKFREEAISRPDDGLLGRVCTALGKIRIENSWHTTAGSIYRNWLQYICAQKERHLERSNFVPLGHATLSLSPILASSDDAAASPAPCEA
jgi:homoserine O-succinyltransferase